jgi:glycosyltransferase involved in cell wall biosynthesis
LDIKPQILVLAESLDVNASSAAKGRVAFINSFKAAGFTITVYHYSQKDISIDGVNCISIFELKYNVLYLLSRLHRVLIRWFNLDFSKYIETLLGFSFGFFSDRISIYKSVKDIDINKYKMVWTFGQGTSFRTHSVLLKLPKWHKKWYAFIHDPYPQHLYPRPYNFVEYGFKKKRYFFIDVTKKALKVVFPSELLKDWMLSYYGAIKNKNIILPHPFIANKCSKDNLPLYFDASKFNIIHAGNLLNLRDPFPLIEAYERFLNKHPEAKKDSSLLLVGKRSIYHDYLKDKQQSIAQLYVSNDYEEFNNVYTMQQFASINVILEAQSEISPFLPGKFPHCLSAGKPILVIGPYYSESKRLLGSKYPYIFDFKDILLITEAFGQLYSQWKNSRHKLTLNRPDLVHYFSVEYCREILLNEIQNENL